MADPTLPHPEEPATRASRRTLDGPPTHGWYSATFGALSAWRVPVIEARSADSTSGTPVPLTPDSTMTSRLAARFSLVRFALMSAGAPAAPLFRPTVPRFAGEAAPIWAWLPRLLP